MFEFVTRLYVHLEIKTVHNTAKQQRFWENISDIITIYSLNLYMHVFVCLFVFLFQYEILKFNMNYIAI